jgi:hypothetical protein
MKRYAIHEPFLLSFYAKELYVDVARRWSGFALGYLFLLMALAWLPTMVQFHLQVSSYTGKHAHALAVQFPPMTLRGGQLSVEGDAPVYVKDPESGALLVIVDPGGQHTSLEGTEARVLLTRTQVLLRRSPQETRAYSLAGFGDTRVEPADIERWMRLAGNWLAAFFYPFALAASYLYRVAQALLYAAIGVLFARGAKVALDYPALVRLAVIAVTPAVIVDTLRDIARVPVPLWPLVCFVIAMAYLQFGVNAVAQAPPESTAAPPPLG